MSYVKKLIDIVFADPTAREVVDLITLMEHMANDFIKGTIDEEGMRTFLKRNKLYLNAVISNNAKIEINADELIEKIVETVVLEAMSKHGGGLSRLYAYKTIKKEIKKQEEGEGEAKII